MSTLVSTWFFKFIFFYAFAVTSKTENPRVELAKNCTVATRYFRTSRSARFVRCPFPTTIWRWRVFRRKAHTNNTWTCPKTRGPTKGIVNIVLYSLYVKNTIPIMKCENLSIFFELQYNIIQYTRSYHQVQVTLKFLKLKYGSIQWKYVRRRQILGL